MEGLADGVDGAFRSSIVFQRSPVHLHRLQQDLLSTRKIKLTKAVKKSVSGHLKDALLFALEGAKRDHTGACKSSLALFSSEG